MNNKFLAEKIALISKSIPHEIITSLLPTLEAWDSSNWQLSKARAFANLHNPGVRAAFQELIDVWFRESPEVSGNAIALAFRASLSSYDNRVQMDLVWTGPETKAVPIRRTEQALLELIDASRKRLLIVSFAVYKVKSICEAVETALSRGVTVEICVESSEESEGILSFSGEKMFGQLIKRAADWYIWPREVRVTSSSGDHGALHAKIALADRDHLFLSSANLTEYAMQFNMEMGIMIKGGNMPGKVEDHFDELKESKILVRKKFR